jgi:UDP-N-acetylglucosamine 4,6-dehydratase
MIFDGKTVLITGGTGSLGQALIKEILKTNVIAVRSYSRGEYLRWSAGLGDHRLRYFTGDIRDVNRLDDIMDRVDIVIHTAALKHVPIGETEGEEFIKTNVVGVSNVIRSAFKHKVSKVIGVSSDKSVNPVNLYGATKLLLEKLFIQANKWALPTTAFSCFRPGNFFQSHGNVFELWDTQAKEGYCTITDVEMYRYFIDINETAGIILNCVDTMYGGEIFIPKMTEYSMLKLLKARYPDVQLKITGKRPGERLHENLMTDDEMCKVQECGTCYILRS